MNKHTVVALVQDQPGVLNRIVSLFRRRGYNIESLAVGHTESEGISRLTLVVEAADVEQVGKQLYRLIDVLKVSDVTDDPTVEREMVLVKLHAPSEKRAEIVALTEVFDAKIVDVGANSLIIEMTGAPGKVQNFIDVIRAFGVKEMMRTGRIAMVRGTRGRQRSPADRFLYNSPARLRRLREYLSMKYRLLTPGPTPVPEETLLELARPVPYHRTPEFRERRFGVVQRPRRFPVGRASAIVRQERQHHDGVQFAAGFLGFHPRLELRHRAAFQSAMRRPAPSPRTSTGPRSMSAPSAGKRRSAAKLRMACSCSVRRPSSGWNESPRRDRCPRSSG